MRTLDENSYPHLARLVAEVLALWPEHDRYLDKSLGARDQVLMRHSEKLAGMVSRLSSTIAGGMATLASDYRFLCQDIVLPEELHFRRTGSYRLTKFQDALREVYNDHAFMTRYMNGLLISDVLWINHCQGLQHYVDFIAGLRPQADVLEIGPGTAFSSISPANDKTSANCPRGISHKPALICRDMHYRRLAPGAP